MDTLVVYHSVFGHTQQIASIVADALKSAGSVRLLSFDEMQADDLAHADVVVMGAPTHRMNLPEVVKPSLERAPRRILRGKAVAAFDTSYKMSALLSRFTAARRLAGRLKRLGGTQLLPPETFHVQAREGPLHEGEIERAREWGLALAKEASRRSQ